MTFTVVIPVRYASLRLPGKALIDICGKPMIQWVYEQAKASGAQDIIVATDDERILQCAQGFGAKAKLTRIDHLSGTDRIAEVIEQLNIPAETCIVNLQGDEPLMPPAVINQVANNLYQHADADMATVCEPITDLNELFNPHNVKVVSNQNGYALYFSRAVIPWDRQHFSHGHTDQFSLPELFYRHVGIYAQRAGFIRKFVGWTDAPIEQLEALEQLRALWYGARIHVAPACALTVPGVDTLEDLKRVEKLCREIDKSFATAQ